ncbi:hypothetical protein [Butyrivibrio sp. AC2005]|uniref:hypothetical protein n=1 Tax=Butyrivibrio sp. AC2005 TaxID=1280672 RepID=UPI0004016D0F|nr:hypothetical protein [Butyrivibrio sp. AC2005]
MKIQIYGQYDFENFTMLNALMDEKDVMSTAIHEYTHFVLSNQSTYGLILYCLNKIIIPIGDYEDNNRKKASKDFFFINTIKVQEGLAVFIEAIFYMLKSENEYACFIETLRNNNVQYYNFLKPFLHILSYLKNENNENRLTIAHKVFQLALYSMNTKIYEFDGELFGKKKTIQKLVSSPDFSKKYLPNKIFLSMITSCESATTFDDILDKLSEPAETKYVADLITSEERLNKTKEFVLSIFKNSKRVLLYRNILDRISIQEKEIANIFLQQLPTAFNEEDIVKNLKKIDYDTLKTRCISNKYSTLFLLGNLKDSLNYVLFKMGINDEISWKNSVSQEVIFFYDLIQKEIFSCFLSKDEIQDILLSDNIKSIVLTAYKNYDYKNDIIPNHENIRKTIYVYCDRTYSNAREIIDKWGNRTIYYRYMFFASMVVLLIRSSRNTIFILPMTPLVADEAERDIQDNRKNMKAITTTHDGEYDDFVIKDSQIEEDINTIINCLFFLNMT